MAKMKTFAVEVEFVVKRTLFIDARREGGAREKIMSDEGWREATRRGDEDETDVLPYSPTDKDLTITRIREVGR